MIIMKEKQDININAPNGTIIILGSSENIEVARQLETLANQNNILTEQLKAKDELIKSLDHKLKELESK